MLQEITFKMKNGQDAAMLVTFRHQTEQCLLLLFPLEYVNINQHHLQADFWQLNNGTFIPGSFLTI